MNSQNGGFETPAENGMLTNLVEMGQARDKILSLKLDQVSCLEFPVPADSHQSAICRSLAHQHRLVWLPQWIQRVT